jgi:hypothetical protein
MPIERDGKHWCEPAAETPDENGRWSCTCGTVWTYDAAGRLWSPEPADTKRKTRARKAGAE